LSQRSNGLAFSQHHFLSTTYGASPSTRPSKKHTSVLSPRSTNQANSSWPPPKKPSLLDVVDENGSEVRGSTHLPGPVRQGHASREALKASTPNLARRPSSSATSVRSITSSHLSRKRKITPVPTLETIPFEIQDQIFSSLPQETLHALLLTSNGLVEAAAIAMYSRPEFASTYRFAQFVTTITHSQHYAEMVRVVDLSKFGQDDLKDLPLAGWREWKYRTEPLYSIQREIQLPGGKIQPGQGRQLDEQESQSNPTHAKPNPFLKQWSTCRDVPTGALIHVLKACKRIKLVLAESNLRNKLTYSRKVDLSYLSIAADYAIKTSSHPPTAFTSLIFVSDVPKSWTWRPKDLQQVHGKDIVEYMTNLPQLEKVRIKKGFWLSTELVSRMVDECDRLRMLNLRESGMKQQMPWAIKGTREEVKKILGKEMSLQPIELPMLSTPHLEQSP